MAAIDGRICDTLSCEKPAKLQCPTCIKLGIAGSYFCEQSCFKASWKTHKQVHKKVEQNQEEDPLNKLLQQYGSSVAEQFTSSVWPGYMFTGNLRPAYPLSPKRDVPKHIQRPDYADHPRHPLSERKVKGSTSIECLSTDDINRLRKVCRFARECLDAGARAVRPGITTDEIDSIVHKATIERDCYPSPLNYYEFPKSCCTSVNEVICHGIPDKRPLEEGDIVNLDITCYYDGFHADLNETLFVGKVDEESQKLVQTAYDSLMAAVNEVKPGVRYRDLGKFIQKVAQDNGCSVTRTYCGHGIHRLFHTAPNVPHYAKNKAVGIMKPGHVFTIEPMINQGTWQDTIWLDDWTAVTKDGKRSAQFEQTFLVTETGVETLTARKESDGRPYFMDQLEGKPL